MESIAQALANGLEHFRNGRYQEAQRIYRRIVSEDPRCADAWRILGMISLEAGQHEDATNYIQRAIALVPTDPVFHGSLGMVHASRGDWPAAVECFRRAAQAEPQNAEWHNNLGTCLISLGQPEEALACFSEAARLQPDFVAAHFNLGRTLHFLGRLEEAVASFQYAARLEHRRSDIYCAMGRVLEALGRHREALAAYRRTIELDPADTAALNGLGNVLQELRQYEEAERIYQQALAVNPGFAPAHSNLGYLLADQGRIEEAERHYREALRLQPSPLLWLLAETMLPPICESKERMDSARARLAANLHRMLVDGVRVDPAWQVLPTLFYIAYHGQNDRDLMTAMARLGQSSWPARVSPRSGTRAGKIQIGFLSRNLRNHTIGALMAGVIEHLDRTLFDVVVLSVGHYDDRRARHIRECATRYVEVPPSLPAALHAVESQALDILFYPDIGMDPLTYTLAFTRLAPVQVVTWGHPVTTGLPTVDYFISSADLDQPDAQDHYTEKLVRLRTLSVCYERPVPPTPLKGRSFFGLPEDAHVYACPHTLFKFHPDFDEILGQILRADLAGIVVLIEGRYPRWKEFLQERFQKSIPDVIDHLRWLPRQSHEDYLNLLAVSDIMLDPTHFGGGNSSYEGLALGIPIVTLPSAFLKNRITYALYKKMNVMDCVVGSREEYIRLAVELGANPSRRQSIRDKMLEACSVLYDDREAVRELGQFLQSIAPPL